MAQYPSNVATDANLLVAVDNCYGTLNNAVNASATSIVVATGGGAAPVANSVLLIDSEQMFVTAVTGSNPYTCTVTRGFASIAASHSGSALVQGAITATHHNALSAEIKAIQTALGASLSNVQSASLPLTTKGDLLGFGTMPVRVPVGVDGQYLVADSSQASGLNWKSLGAMAFNSLSIDPASTPSYSPDGTGNRTSWMSVTAFGDIVNNHSSEQPYSLCVDGTIGYQGENWSHQNDYIIFGFGNRGAVKVTEVTWHLSNYSGTPVGAWYGSNDRNNWTFLTNTVNLTSATVTDTSLATNAQFFKYYKWVFTAYAGLSINEVEFKFATSVSATPAFEVSGQATFNGNLILPNLAPSSLTDNGTAGQIAWDTTYLYIGTGTNVWRTVPLGVFTLSSGQVGIGGTPSDALHVMAASYPYVRVGKSDGSISMRLGIESSFPAVWLYGTGALQIQNATASSGITTVNVAAGAGQGTAHLMNWNDNAGNTQAYITSNGNVVATMVTAISTGGGVGFVRLQPGTASASGFIEWKNASGTRLGYIGNDTANFTLNLENSASFVVNGGSMGIGKAPATTFDVSGYIGSSSGYRWGSAVDGSTGQLVNSGGDTYLDYSGSLHVRALSSSTAERLRMDAAGQLGLGLSGTAPGYMLDVQGSQYNLIRARSTGSNTAAIMLDVASSGQQTNLTFADAGTNKWTLGKGSDNAFFLYDWARSANAITIASNGSMSLMPSGGDVRVGKSNSLSGTLTVMDATPTTGVTRFIVKAGAANVSSAVPAMAIYSDWITNSAQFNLFSISANQQVSLALYGATNATGWILGRDYASAGSNEFFFYSLSLAKFTTFIDNATGNFCIAGGASPTTVAGGGGYNSQHLCLGVYHIWVDGSGRLRIKSSAPAADTDGTIVGSQS